MADIRINALATTAASTASDDFVAVDGSANGTRKLNAYSPTFGGNLTVSGTGTIGNQLKVTNASVPDLWLQNTSGATSAYRNILLRQNSDSTFKFLSISDAGVLTRDNIITGSNDTGAIGIGVAPSAGVNSLTVAGNLTVSGTGGITVNPNQNAQTFVKVSNANAGASADSTFQLANNSSTTNWGMRSTGAAAYFALDAGSSYLWYNGTTSLVIGATNAAGIIKFHAGGLTEQMRLFANGNLFVGASPVDGGQKLQVSGTAAITGAISIGNTVNTVSPTSPNRTITMVIGGTTYYIHAKTTND